MTDGTEALSGGQVQRLLIARALVSEPRILLFDEATSALDNRTQAIVTDSLSKLAVTRIAIAHRLSAVKNADCIYVMHEGRVPASGLPQCVQNHPRHITSGHRGRQGRNRPGELGRNGLGVNLVPGKQAHGTVKMHQSGPQFANQSLCRNDLTGNRRSLLLQCRQNMTFRQNRFLLQLVDGKATGARAGQIAGDGCVCYIMPGLLG